MAPRCIPRGKCFVRNSSRAYVGLLLLSISFNSKILSKWHSSRLPKGERLFSLFAVDVSDSSWSCQTSGTASHFNEAPSLQLPESRSKTLLRQILNDEIVVLDQPNAVHQQCCVSLSWTVSDDVAPLLGQHRRLGLITQELSLLALLLI